MLQGCSIAESLEQSEGMQQLVFQLFVAIHGQDQFAGRTNNASGALDEGPVSWSSESLLPCLHGN